MERINMARNKPLTTLQLWNKFQHSSLRHGEYCTTKELQRLHSRLNDIQDFMKNAHVINHGLLSMRESISNTLLSRGARVS